MAERLGAPQDWKNFVDLNINPITSNELVRQAFLKVDRRDFVPKGHGYEDLARTNKIIPLSSSGATISQPTLLATILDRLEPTGKGRILEVGAGSGYFIATCAQCFEIAHGIERKRELVRMATENTKGYSNVVIHTGDGAYGLLKEAPFEAIVVSAAARSIPQPLKGQLTVGGKIIAPLGEDYSDCMLTLGIKQMDGNLATIAIARVTFVPLISDVDGGWKKSRAIMRAIRRFLERK